MNKTARRLCRLAGALHTTLQSQPATAPPPELPEARWQQCQVLLRRLHRACDLKWQFAAARIERCLYDRVQELRQELSAIEVQLAPRRQSPPASLRDIHMDLVALLEEFEDVEFDLKARTVEVTTEPIELEGLYLGPFRIKLDWTDLSDHPHNYSVIAVDPQPAASNDGVTHPHVQDDNVCEGDGRQPIRNALKEARLFDFFTLVANLLRTYNSASPYVSIEDWYGTPCADCDHAVGDGDRYICDRCDANLCGECMTNCPDCDGIVCGQCSGCCDKCEDRHCESCLTLCDKGEKNLCSHCHEQERIKNQNDQHQEKRATEAIPTGNLLAACQPGAAVHALRVE